MIGQGERAVSPTIAIILMVAVSVLLSAAVGVFVFNIGQSVGGSADSQSSVAARMDEKPDGMYVTIISTDSRVDVLKEGSVVHTFETSDVGATVRISGLSEDESVSLRTNGTSESLVMSKTASASIPLSGDGSEVLSGGSETISHMLAWNSSSDWDAGTSTGVEHSSLNAGGSVRLGTLEDDGDVSEYQLGTNNSSDRLIEPASHDTVASSVGIGPHARRVVSNTTSDNYSYIAFAHSTETAPDKTILWLKLPKPDNDDWVYNFGFHDSAGEIVTRVAFDGAGTASGANVSTLNASSGWSPRSDYPANTWFRVVVDWDWSTDSYELFVDGTSTGTEGFRSGSADGYLEYYELWDYRNGGLEGYVDPEAGLPYTASGTMVTAAQTTSAPLDVSTLELQNASHTLNGQTATAYVESDTDGDGTFDETSDAITFDGSESYTVTGLSTSSDRFRVRIEMGSDHISTPQLSGLEVVGDEA